jgi:hypothetical protein
VKVVLFRLDFRFLLCASDSQQSPSVELPLPPSIISVMAGPSHHVLPAADQNSAIQFTTKIQIENFLFCHVNKLKFRGFFFKMASMQKMKRKLIRSS